MVQKELKWYRMDNSAKLYPVMTTLNSQSLYRVSVVLDYDIEKDVLQQAVEQALERFPNFNVRLRRGIFWYYFEENIKPPVVTEDDGVLLAKFNSFRLHDYLFRVSYFGRKFSIDFFHALTDGAGSTEFLKAVVAKYMTLKGTPTDLKIFHTEPTPEEYEDGFKRYYDPSQKFELDLKEFTGQKSYKVTGDWFRGMGYGLIQATMPTADVIKIAKKHGCTMTVLLAALAMKSIYESDPQEERAISIMVPVNLRSIFPSKTLYNFVLFVSLRVVPKKEYTLEDYIRIAKEQLANETQKEKIQKKINISVKGLKMPIFRYMPLVLKYLAIKFGRLFVKGGSQTMIFSNLGVFDAEGMNIESVTYNMNVSKNSAINMSAISNGGNGKLEICFTRAMKSTDIEMRFLRALADEGAEITVQSNYREKVKESGIYTLVGGRKIKL